MRNFGLLALLFSVVATAGAGVAVARSHEGTLTFYPDRGSFQAANPGLALETFTATLVPPDTSNSCPAPLNNMTNDACFPLGGVIPGFDLSVTPSGQYTVDNHSSALGCIVTGAGTSGTVLELDFDPAVAAIGLDLFALIGGAQNYSVEVFGPGGSLGSTIVSAAFPTVPAFFGVHSSDPQGVTRLVADNVVDLPAFICDLEFGDGPPPEGALEIFEIQGSGTASPFVGQVVSTDDNVVTATGPLGFYIQTPDSRDDGDEMTSNGLYVFTGAPPTVMVGDLVDVTGEVQEFSELTELSSNPAVTIDSTGNPLPTAIVFDATNPAPDPATPEDVLERYEGMRVSMPVGITTGPTNQFNENPIVATTERTFREPGIRYPGLPGLPVWDGNPEVIEIDHAGGGLPAFAAFSDRSISAEGPLSYEFGAYSIQPTSYTVDDTVEPPTPVGLPASYEFTVATQNLLFFYDDVDDPTIDEPVLTPAEFQDRLTKTSLWVRTVLGAPDILAVQEVENLNALTALAAQILLDDATISYSAHLIEGNDTSGIDVGYLTRDGRVTVDSLAQFGEDLQLSLDGSLLYDRPPLVLEATLDSPATDPMPLTVINVHQRSLIGIEGLDATYVKTKRFEQAAELADFVQSQQEATPAIHLLVTGDFNAYEFTDGYVDVIGQISGNLDPLGDEIGTTDTVDPDLFNWTRAVPASERYSFVFQGSALALDHALSSRFLTSRVRRSEFARGNADAPYAFADDPGTALRSSDHDGLVIFIAAPSEIFADGFESGDTSAWSSTVE